MREISSSITFEIKPGETVPMRMARGTTSRQSTAAPSGRRAATTSKITGSSPAITLELREASGSGFPSEGDRPAYVVFTMPTALRRARDALGFDAHRAPVAQRLRAGWRTV